jgi:hypothetical protein
MGAYALEFDGSISYVTFGDDPAFSFGDGLNDSAFSVELWIKPAGTGNGVIIGKDSSEREWSVALYGDTLYFMLLADAYGTNYSDATLASASTYLTAGYWHHLVVTYDGRGGANASAGMCLYIDNTDYTSSLSPVDSGGYSAMTAGNDPLQISHGKSVGGSGCWAGVVEEPRIYSRVLSSTDVANHYNSGDGLYNDDKTGMILGCHFDEGTGTDVADYSGNAHDGVAYYTSWVSSTICLAPVAQAANAILFGTMF